jgi:adenylate cyclase
MTDFSRQETADRAGVTLERVNQLVDLGILTPTDGDRFSTGHARRIVVAGTLEEAGMPVEGLATLIQNKEGSLDYLDSPMFDRIAAHTTVTFRELSASSGVPLELLLVLREAVGAAAAEPDDLVREDEMDIIPFLEVSHKNDMSQGATERLLRVMGDSLRRIAEQQADWWQTEVVMPLFRQGVKAGDLGNATAKFGERTNVDYQRAFLAIQHAQEARTWTANVLTEIEMAMTNAGLYTRQVQPPAMCFFDITGYTRLTQERGDEAAAELATTFSRMVQRTSNLYAGRAVKWLGDGVMFHFPQPALGVVAALEMLAGATEAGLPPAHVGLHAGPVLFQEGDYFGQTVNLAARIADYARPGEVLVSQAVVEASTDDRLAFAEIGPVELKGVNGPTQLHAARRA